MNNKMSYYFSFYGFLKRSDGEYFSEEKVHNFLTNIRWHPKKIITVQLLNSAAVGLVGSVVNLPVKYVLYQIYR